MGAPNETLIELSTAYLKQFADVLDRHMRGRSYVAGDHLTIADYSIIHLEWFKEQVPFDWAPYPNLNAYYDRMRKVEHWAKTAPASPAEMGRRPKAAA